MTSKYHRRKQITKREVETVPTSHTLILRQVAKGSRVLECGPADGLMTRYLKKTLGCHVSVIEIDPKAYAAVMKIADEGCCASLEDDDWMSQFQDASFDYILYADVLEHLKDPLSVLKKMRRFLKPDGNVLLSVPNAAYGDLLMNLLSDRFTYTPLGLLDNTHVHLFARNNLRDMIRDAGYYLAYETCVTVPLFLSEQAAFIPAQDRGRLEAALESHPTRYVYQYVCRLTRVKTETVSDVELLNEAMAQQERTGHLDALASHAWNPRSEGALYFQFNGAYSQEHQYSFSYCKC